MTWCTDIQVLLGVRAIPLESNVIQILQDHQNIINSLSQTSGLTLARHCRETLFNNPNNPNNLENNPNNLENNLEMNSIKGGSEESGLIKLSKQLLNDLKIATHDNNTKAPGITDPTLGAEGSEFSLNNRLQTEDLAHIWSFGPRSHRPNLLINRLNDPKNNPNYHKNLKTPMVNSGIYGLFSDPLPDEEETETDRKSEGSENRETVEERESGRVMMALAENGILNGFALACTAGPLAGLTLIKPS